VAGGVGITAWKVLDREGTHADDHAGSPTSASPPSADKDDATTAATPTSSATTTANSGEDTPARKVIAKTADIPVGGGLIVEKETIVVTQPEQGSFRAFSAVCTHQGCPVTSISAGVIRCPCHNSDFDITDGSVLGGPATTGLTNRQIDIRGDSIEITTDT